MNHGHKDHHTGWLSPFVDGMRMKRIAKYIKIWDHVLDIGCGPRGHLYNYLSLCLYTGIDTEIDSSIGAPAVLVKLDATKELNFFQPQKFDVIVMASFLEHIDNPSGIFHELERILSPRGIIVATTPTPLGGKVHEVMAHLGMLSLDAAHDHTHGFLEEGDFHAMAKGTKLKVSSYKKFQFGLNQIVTWKK